MSRHIQMLWRRCIILFFPAILLAGTAAQMPSIHNQLEALPYRFEENRGQSANDSRFVAHRGNYEVLAAAEGPVLLLKKPGAVAQSLRTVLRGANRYAVISGERPLETRTNYLVGNDETKWLRAVPSYERVRYAGVYPSVDLVFHGNERNFEFDFEVKPGGDPSRIALSWPRADGIRVDEAGDLVVGTPAGDVRWAKPVIYQQSGGARKEIAGRFRVRGKTVSFDVAEYDRARTLVIDPTVSFATYVGANGNEAAKSIGIDGNGNILIAGYTTSSGLPTTASSAQAGYGGGTNDTITGDAFVAQLNPGGTALNWITYLGGNQDDLAFGMAVDTAGNSYVTGMTNSTNFPVKNAAYAKFLGAGGNALNPMGDAFVAKLNASGQLVYSTYYGGAQDDWGMAIAADAAGNAYVTGVTLSTNFPVSATAAQKTFKGSGGNAEFCGGCGPVFLSGDAFAAKFDPTGKPVWATYVGGAKDDSGTAIAVDGSSNVYIAGGTLSSDFPVTSGVFQTKYAGASSVQSQPNIHMGDGFVTKIDPTGATFLYSTYLGGSQDDAIFGMAVDSNGSVYVTGATVSADFPVTTGAFQTTFAGPSTAPARVFTPTFVYGDGFAAKLNPTGTGLSYATYFGGSGDDAGQAISVDASGNAYIAGFSASSNFPVTAGAIQSTFGGSGGDVQAVGDIILLQLDAKGAKELYGTYYGGKINDAGASIALDGAGNAYVSGFSGSNNFPTTAGAFKTTIGGSSGVGTPAGDAVVVKFSGLTPANGPVITPGGVVPVYSSSTTIQPGEWFSIFGTNLAAATSVWNGEFPKTLGGTTVTVDGKNAYLWFVSSGQINAQAPDDATTGNVPVVVTNSQGSTNGSVTLGAAGPSFLVLPDGKHVTGIIYTPNGNGSQGGGSYDLLGPTSAGAGFRPAAKGEHVAIYAVGLGPTTSPVPAGQPYTCPAAGCAQLSTAPDISLGGSPITADFAGVVSAGLYQINLTIPNTAGSGDISLVATLVGGAKTQSSIVIPLQ